MLVHFNSLFLIAFWIRSTHNVLLTNIFRACVTPSSTWNIYQTLLNPRFEQKGTTLVPVHQGPVLVLSTSSPTLDLLVMLLLFTAFFTTYLCFACFFLFWVSVWQKTFGERKAWHVDIEVTVCGMHLIIRRLWRPLHFLYSDSCSVVTPECLHAGIMLLPDSSLKPSLTETELLLNYLSRHQHDMYVSQDTTLVLLQALDISTLDHSHVLLAYIIFQVISLQLIQNATVFQIFTLPKRPTATLPRLASCSSLHQIQVPDVTLQRQVCTGTCLLPRLWWNLFHSSKNCQIYCLPGALLSWRSSQTWGNPVLCSCSHLQWIPVEIKTAETCTSSSKSKTCLLKNKGNFKKNGEMTFFYFSSTDPALCVLHPTTPASCSGHMFTPCGT